MGRGGGSGGGCLSTRILVLHFDMAISTVWVSNWRAMATAPKRPSTLALDPNPKPNKTSRYRPKLPYTPGTEAAGIIRAVGKKATVHGLGFVFEGSGFKV